MRASTSSRAGIAKGLRTFTVLAAASLLAALLSSCASSGRSSEKRTPGTQISEDARLREDWRVSIAQVPLPKQGCFEGSYPSKDWREVLCTTGPDYSMPPKRGPRPFVVGNGDDVAAKLSPGFISTAIGSFDSVTGVTSESGPIGNSGPAVANAYTLQLNTNFFASTVCSTSPNPSCQGWEQFVFENNNVSHRAFIQYWLLKYNTTCPSGQSWNQFSFSGSTDIYCWKNNTAGAVNVPNQPITNLQNLSLSGAVSSSGDSVTVMDGGTAYARTGDNAVNAAVGWNVAEFNIFGDGGNSAGGGQASFNAGSTVVPRPRVLSGSTAAPTCVAQGFTGETNNLNFGTPAPAVGPPGPALFFKENTAGGATTNCAAATSVGDTHLDTVQQLFYDFQSSGDFVLAQVDPDFVVQARQVSGAPTWPNASVNHAVATQMGKDTVAVCSSPTRLNVDGENADLADGETISTADGVDVTRRGNVYSIVSQSGDSVRATVNSSYIDVSVGFGHWPATVAGLLANANGNVNQIAARDGTVLTTQFAFDDLYHRYGDSWRVSPRESLLSVCGDGNVETGSPKRPFFAHDLPPELYKSARAVCTTAGVKGQAFLDACTLDVAVIGDNAAAQVFVGLPQPAAVGNPVGATGHKHSGLAMWWWLLLLLLLALILLISWLIWRRRHP